MEGKRALYLIGMIGTVLYNVLQLTIPYFSGKIVDLFLTGENAVQIRRLMSCQVDFPTSDHVLSLIHI